MSCRRAVITALGAGLLLSACAGPARRDGPRIVSTGPGGAAPAIADELDRWWPVAALLVGEQHDAPEHQALQLEVVQALLARRALAALVLEMVERGRSTADLPADASEAAVREALAWSDRAWPWAAYGPAILAAVRAGVAVHGGNLPRSAQAGAQADAALDERVPPAALQALRRQVRDGHCGLLPEARIPAMTRIQIARDRTMAEAVAQSLRPGATVVLLAGQTHVSRALGVPLHLPGSPSLRVLWAAAGSSRPAAGDVGPGDLVWVTPPLPPHDACAPLRAARPASAADRRP